MTADPLLTLFLPVALGIIMLGLGLSLTLADFARVVKLPKPVLIGLSCQLVLLPLVCFFLAKAFGLEPALAVGLMLLAASPGGTTANLYSHLAHGDVALNITLTAVNSVVAVLTMPLIVNLSLAYFMDGDQALPLQFTKVVQVFAIVLGPVAIGMWIRSRFEGFAARMEKPVKIISALFLLIIILLAVVKDWQTFVDYAPLVGGAALAFNLISLAVGYWVPRLMKLSLRQSIAIGMEIGIHNGTLAIALALSPMLLNNPTMSIPAAIYSIIMFFTAAAFGWWVNFAHGKELLRGE
ncbi:MAG: bile acid:sodium symporter family protein [Gammaproteobacteria bacterium]|jgi:BASS family bile acid:Na+ symporter|uniref:bile acid:sodium symporter family protein n=1 Tax=Pseudomonas sp. MIL19 TaxID=2976979 RepID=UPI001DE5B0C0|nr:bile acid:sodium symporter family protein [Pseudomonas sp. MIL19]MBU0522818.1 bile acid:sodium symporter family protein [Gammaproteobacteria bacterium]MBU0807959.1 bile acid:sodium symporter family protein [Gammaproteobacteria bacterium]MBU0882542.1 bile acid:sodium symporter family protein [Gammaproteobacteria bacterium]MBU1861133.1 bile acid:sodium symporter family protein [Gammaproteobacteria bacterium]MDD2161300.1 bile acid:sodium symporter family protein [Pseudomonas sp. MIL19]